MIVLMVVFIFFLLILIFNGKIAKSIVLSDAEKEAEENKNKMERLRNLLAHDHAKNCEALTKDVPCSCGWNDGSWNADEEITKVHERIGDFLRCYDTISVTRGSLAPHAENLSDWHDEINKLKTRWIQTEPYSQIRGT